MTESELNDLKQKARAACQTEPGDWWYMSSQFSEVVDDPRDAEFIAAVSPEVVLKLIEMAARAKLRM